RASLLQILCSARSERQLMEQLDDNLLFRWFVGLGIDDAVWVPTVFSRNRDRLLTSDMSRKVMAFVGETVPRTVFRSSSFLAHREVAPLLSDDHFSVDGTLVKAWASMKSLRPKEDGRPPKDGDPGDPPAQDAAPQDPSPQPGPEPRPMARPASRSRNAEVNFKGEKRSNTTHASTTDPEARLYRKSPGTGAMLCFMGHAVMEMRRVPPPVRGTRRLRSGLAVQGELTQACGRAERKAALDMMHRQSPGSTRRLTPGAELPAIAPPVRATAGDTHDVAGFAADCRRACIAPHVAQKARFSAIGRRTTRHEGHALSQRPRKRIEELFGWSKTVGGAAQAVYRGVERLRSRFILALAAANLARLPRLLAI
ncbi:transposase, partial [Poseidonocella sp. HB161398]|uniref:transposase n=1 Tax=Poseidonocella sp. HB161398 TaxID=2320855 RepID=UPI001109FE6C